MSSKQCSTPASLALKSLGLVPETALTSATQTKPKFLGPENVDWSSPPVTHPPSGIANTVPPPRSTQVPTPTIASVGKLLLPASAAGNLFSLEMPSASSITLLATASSTGKREFKLSNVTSSHRTQSVNKRKRIVNIKNETEKSKQMEQRSWQQLLANPVEESNDRVRMDVRSTLAAPKLKSEQANVERQKLAVANSSSDTSSNTSGTMTDMNEVGSSSGTVVTSQESRAARRNRSRQKMQIERHKWYQKLASYLPEAHGGAKLTNARIFALGIDRLKELKKLKSKGLELEKKLKAEIAEEDHKMQEMHLSTSKSAVKLTSVSQLRGTLYKHMRSRVQSDLIYGFCCLLVKPWIDMLTTTLSTVPVGSTASTIFTCNSWILDHVKYLGFKPYACQFVVNLVTQMRAKTHPDAIRELIDVETEKEMRVLTELEENREHHETETEHLNPSTSSRIVDHR